MINVQIQSNGTVIMWEHISIIFYVLWSWSFVIPSSGRWEGVGWWKMPLKMPRFDPTPKRKFISP